MQLFITFWGDLRAYSDWPSDFSGAREIDSLDCDISAPSTYHELILCGLPPLWGAKRTDTVRGETSLIMPPLSEESHNSLLPANLHIISEDTVSDHSDVSECRLQSEAVHR